MRGNTALAHAFDYEVEAEPELLDNVIPIGQRRTLLELTETPAAGRSAIPATPEFFFCGGTVDDQPALLRLSLARRLSAGQRRGATGGRPCAAELRR